MEKNRNWRALEGGNLNEVFTDGKVVRRKIEEHSESIHNVIKFLNDNNLDFVPKLLEVDETYEFHEFISGKSAFRPWDERIKQDEWMIQIGGWLKKFHSLMKTFRDGSELSFSWGPSFGENGAETICHGDLGPWNFLHADGQLVGVIDWDLMKRGAKFEDLAQIALEHIPLREPIEGTMGEGCEKNILQKRLQCLCDSYGGPSPEELIDYVLDYLKHKRIEVRTRARQGDPLFQSFVAYGDLEQFDKDLLYIEENWK